jgi:hypothetical protein
VGEVGAPWAEVAEDDLLSGVFLLSLEARGWLTFKFCGETVRRGCLWLGGVPEEDSPFSLLSDLGLFGDSLRGAELGGLDLLRLEPSMLDSILLQACVNIASGLTLESNSFKKIIGMSTKNGILHNFF